MNENMYWIWLSRLNEVPIKTLLALITKYQNPKAIWKLKKKELKQNELKIQEVEAILNPTYRKNLDKYFSYMQKNEIELISIIDEKYPEKLNQIFDPPVVLYVKGNKEILNDTSIAIIGCRLCSRYGETVAKQISYEIAQKKINIISGLARGIDTCAHIGALNAMTAKTIAVVGTGLDTVYPAENRDVFHKIIENGGAVVSEYAVGTRPRPENFPARNRIISGLSDGVLVVEAKEKSGTFITVDFALEQGKEIYAVPGNITSVSSKGTNKLIKEGAKPVTTAEDVLEDFEF